MLPSLLNTRKNIKCDGCNVVMDKLDYYLVDLLALVGRPSPSSKQPLQVFPVLDFHNSSRFQASSLPSELLNFHSQSIPNIQAYQESDHQSVQKWK